LGIYWPLLVLAFSFLVLATTSSTESSTELGPQESNLGYGPVIACVVAVVCSAGAFIRKERFAWASLILALPALGLLLLFIAALLG
jgi:hypothetical protein